MWSTEDTRETGSGLFLGEPPDAAFAMVHLPPEPAASATGIVLCPLFGWDDLCTHRAKRSWAIALAQAGYPTIRVDLPDAGDSAGSSRSPDRLRAWTDTIANAAQWLRVEAGCSRVCALGIRFGGLLALRAAAEGAPIDDFILWAVPARGRRVVRSQRTAAALGIDTEIHSTPSLGCELPDPIPFDDGDLLDEAGQVTTRDTLDAIASIDVQRLALSDPQRRRILLFQRSDAKSDEDLAALLARSGARVTIADGDGYDALMQYVRFSVTPERAIGDSLRWLADIPPAPGPEKAHGATATTAAARYVDFEHRGAAIRESAVRLDLPSGTVNGIVTSPLDADNRDDVCVVFFGGGSDRRVGPNRLWVELARRWAARGVPAVRVDLPGIGDSPGDESQWTRLKDHYAPIHRKRSVELLDALQASGLPSRFVLVGYCSGAYRSIQIAATDTRIVGVFALGLMFFERTWWVAKIRSSWLHGWKPSGSERRLKAAALTTLRAAVVLLSRLHRTAKRLGAWRPARAERTVRDLAARGVELELILKRSSYAHQQMSHGPAADRVRGLANVTIRTMPDNDERFRPLVSQRFVIHALDEALARVLRPRRSAAGATEAKATSYTHRAARARPATDRRRSARDRTPAG